MPQIRAATHADAAAIADIWRPIIRDTAIIFAAEERSAAFAAAMIRERQGDGFAFLVAAEGARVLGFAAYAQFRPGSGYAHSMEHTIHAAPEARGQGLGRALLRAIEDHARARGARLMIGGITGSNIPSIGFHAHLGYAEWGRIPAAGYKFGQWHDLVLMGRDLTA